jgi:MFS family permease
MLYSQLAVFLKHDLGASAAQIAAIDGFVEFLSYLIRIFSGMISDYLGNRKLLLLIGCSIAILIKPVFAAISSVVGALAAEVVERLGNGIQASPRDALVADLSEKDRLGESFGLCKAMKTCGALVGAAMATAIVYFSDSNYKFLFLCSAVPAFLGYLCLYGVGKSSSRRSLRDMIFPARMEKNVAQDCSRVDNPFQKRYLKSLDRNFLMLMLLAFICELGHFSESMLVIRGCDFVSNTLAGITTIAATIGQTVFAYPVGLLADRMSKTLLLKICLLLQLMAYILMACAGSFQSFIAGVFLASGQQTSLQLLFLSMINQRIDPKLRATAIGIFYSVAGVSYMISTEICGQLCELLEYTWAFSFSAVVCAISIIFCGRLSQS